jgi:PKD domain
MLAEWGSVEDPDQPTRKAQWLQDGLDAARSYPSLRALSYFDSTGSCDWRLQNAAAQQAFADTGADAFAHSRASAFLDPSTQLGIAPLTVHFDGSGSAGTGSATGSGIASWRLDFGDGSSTSGEGQPPADVGHTYPAGTYTARLRVTDTAGDVNQDEQTVKSAGPPVVSGEIRDVTGTSATIKSWVAPLGYGASVTAQWGTSTAYGQQSAPVQLAATDSNVAVSFPLASLKPATRYYARVLATSAAGTGVRAWTFDTPGAPTPTTGDAAWVAQTSATLTGTVNPHALDSKYWYQWGTTTGYGHNTTSASLSAATWNIYVRSGITGLARRQIYHFRLVATNAAGTRYGSDQAFVTQ